MKSQRELHAAEGQVCAAADVSSDSVLYAVVFGEPGRDFIVRDNRRAGPIRDLRRVRDVIEMSMRDENEISRGLVRLQRRCWRVVEKWIDEQRVLAGFQLPARVPEPGEFDGHSCQWSVVSCQS